MDFCSAAGILQRFYRPVFRLRRFALAAATDVPANTIQHTQKRAVPAAPFQSLLHEVPEVFFNG
jgi:hypothetical protein